MKTHLFKTGTLALLILAIAAFLLLFVHRKNNLTDINYITSAGQSLSVGWTARPALKTETNGGGLMFKSGVRPYETGNDKSALVPLQESVSPDGAKGETPLVGTVETFLKQRAKTEGAQAKPVQFLCAANGIGGAPIADLKKGTNAYARILDDLKCGKKLAEAQGKTFSMPAFLWTQGESDQMQKKTKDWYKNELRQLVADMNTDAKAITEQKNDVLCFGYQVSSHLQYFPHNQSSYPTIALAQLELTLEKDSRYIMTTPMYHFQYSDGVHLTAPMSKLYGAHIGYVMKKVLVDGVQWKPIHPLSHKIRKADDRWVVELNFSVPAPPLQMDSQTVSDPGQFGFSILDGKGKDLPVSSISVISPQTIKLIVPINPDGGKILYGMNVTGNHPSGPQTGARGCLRDSQGDKITETIDNKNYRLDNWCPFFEYKLENR